MTKISPLKKPRNIIINKELDSKIVLLAKDMNLSANSWIVMVLTQAVSRGNKEI